MSKPHIIVIDDQPEVLSSLRNDISLFREKFAIDDCESAEEATELLEELDASGASVALILSDHVMPKQSGIDFLSRLSKDDRFNGIYKVLITGQASHADTINAINDASISYYISKPWTKERLLNVCKKMITHWIADNGIDYKEYSNLLDAETLLNRLKKSNSCSE
jgi:two-component system chemotaxis response regulator CheY